MTHPDVAHYCGYESCPTNINSGDSPFCSSIGRNDLACRRLTGHSGPPSAFGFRISAPVTWTAQAAS